jgi:hypothetical protein
MVMTYNPLRVFLPTAMTLALVGGTKLVFDVATKDWRPAMNTLLILFAALQLLAVGLLADLVVRVTRPSDTDPR